MLTVADLDIARDIKERLGYVAVDFDLEMGVGDDSVPLKKTYELPDGTAFTVGNERFRVTEPLFQPALIGEGHIFVVIPVCLASLCIMYTKHVLPEITVVHSLVLPLNIDIFL